MLLGFVFLDTAIDDRELANDPFVVDWTDFPIQEALDALNDPTPLGRWHAAIWLRTDRHPPFRLSHFGFRISCEGP